MADPAKEKQRLLLKSLEFFKPFENDDELDDLLGFCEITKYDKNEYVIKANQEGCKFYVILKGQASVIKESKGGLKQKMAIVSTGDCLGEMAILLNKPRTASVMASEECFVFELDGDRIKQMNIELREKLFMQFAVTLAKKLEKAGASESVLTSPLAR